MRRLPRVPLAPGTVVIGDLHLDLFDAGHAAPFAGWCRELRAPGLVILGDLFEFWVGRKQLQVPGAREVLDALGGLARRGTTIDVLWGNRDYLLDSCFETASGATVRPHGLIGEHDGGPTLFLHGDELCTLDHAYQRFRRVVRSAPSRWLATHLPFAVQRRIAARLRSRSTRAVAAKPAPVRAMQVEAVAARTSEAGARVLVCGHAHRSRDETLSGGERWLVIDAWGGERDALLLGDDGRWRAWPQGEGGGD